MTSSKRIFLVIPTLKQGGAERVMSVLANSFWNLGNVEVHLILLAKGEDFYKVDKGIIIHRLGFENQGSLQKIISEIKTLYKLRKLFIKHKPDAVLSFMEKYNAFTILASAFTGTNVHVSDRSNPLKKVPAHVEFLRKITYRYAKGIVAQTSLAKDILAEKTGNSNIKVIPNPIKEVNIFPGVNREKLILNVGRLVPEKGQQYLIEAFSKLPENDWKLAILGEGKLRTELERQIAELNIKHKVELLGAVQDVDIWLAKASIFAFPSISEGFPNALVEAMGAGLACVSFDCDAGPKDVIDNYKNGVLIEEKNVVEFTLALQQLMDSPDLRLQLGEQAIEIREQLSLEKIAEEYYKFMRN